MKQFCLFALLLLMLGCKATKDNYVGTWKIVKVQINLTGNEADKERMQNGMNNSVEQGAGFEIATDSLFLLDGKELTDVSTPMPLTYDAETGVFTGTPAEGSFAPTMLLQPETLSNDTLITGITMLRGEDLYASGLFTCVKVAKVEKSSATAYENGVSNNAVEVTEKKTCSHGDKKCTQAQKDSCTQEKMTCEPPLAADATTKSKSCGGHNSCSHEKKKATVGVDEKAADTPAPKEVTEEVVVPVMEEKADAAKAQ